MESERVVPVGAINKEWAVVGTAQNLKQIENKKEGDPTNCKLVPLSHFLTLKLHCLQLFLRKVDE